MVLRQEGGALSIILLALGWIRHTTLLLQVGGQAYNILPELVQAFHTMLHLQEVGTQYIIRRVAELALLKQLLHRSLRKSPQRLVQL